MAAPPGRGHAIAVTFRWMQSSRGPGPGREHLEGQDLDLDLFLGRAHQDGRDLARSGALWQVDGSGGIYIWIWTDLDLDAGFAWNRFM